MRTLRQPHWQEIVKSLVGLDRTKRIALGVVLALWLGILLVPVVSEALHPPPRFPPFIMEREVVRDGVFSRYRFKYRDDCNWDETLWERVGGDPDGMRVGTMTWIADGAMYRREDCKIKHVAPRPRVGRFNPGDWLATEAEFADRALAVGGLVVREQDGRQVVVAIELHGERQVMRFHAETGVPLNFERSSYMDGPEEVVVESYEVVWVSFEEGAIYYPRQR